MKTSKRNEVLDVLSGFADEIIDIASDKVTRRYPLLNCESLATQAEVFARAWQKAYGVEVESSRIGGGYEK